MGINGEYQSLIKYAFLEGNCFFSSLYLSLARFLKNIRSLKDDWQGFGR